MTGGELRGFTLKSPKGNQTRPMSDRLKLALFNMLAARDQPRGRVLDLYAGTGALGIECLSRGADSADFVEQNAGMAAIIKENLAHTRLQGRATVHKLSVSSFLARAVDSPYDLVIMDPPYADPEIAGTVGAVGARGWLSPGGLLVLGHSSRREFEERLGVLSLEKQRCHGDSCISFYSKAASEADPEHSDSYSSLTSNPTRE
ncbi:MAG: 16S rRNA (guanine(966)-N(2))-methyltransferase RsmD [Chloroflexota bacterium]|nr:16S rRNA (guanine(966)-N(2))-methyltransferase RsmD [Chloroflexota bacterium]